MRLSIALVSLSILTLACGDDDGGADGDDTTGPSSTDDSSSGSVSVGSESSDSSSGSVGEESSSSGVEGGSTDSSGSESGSDSGSDSSTSADSSGTETGSSTFACGDALECDLATEYCQRQASDVVGMPDTYQCLPLPKACEGVSACDCLDGVPCSDFDLCEDQPEGGAVLTCPGG